MVVRLLGTSRCDSRWPSRDLRRSSPERHRHRRARASRNIAASEFLPSPPAMPGEGPGAPAAPSSFPREREPTVISGPEFPKLEGGRRHFPGIFLEHEGQRAHPSDLPQLSKIKSSAPTRGAAAAKGKALGKSGKNVFISRIGNSLAKEETAATQRRGVKAGDEPAVRMRAPGQSRRASPRRVPAATRAAPPENRPREPGGKSLIIRLLIATVVCTEGLKGRSGAGREK